MAINDALANIYEKLIDKSWTNPDTFEVYQDSWNIVAEAFNVPRFDWTKGQRPKSGIPDNAPLLARRVEVLQALLAEALEYIQDPDDYSPYERGSLENKIEAGLVPAEEE